MRRVLILPVIAALAATLAATACSSSKPATKLTAAASPAVASSGAAVTSAAPGASGSASVGVASGAPSPLATESNPPGDIPDNTAYVPYQPPGANFVLSVPEGWARQVAGNVVTFSDKLNTIGVTSMSAASAPTVQTAKQTTVPQLQSAAKMFELVDVTTTQRKAGPAVVVHYKADSAPNPVTDKVIRDDTQLYQFFHNGIEVDLTVSGPVNADNVDPWKTVTDSLQWK